MMVGNRGKIGAVAIVALVALPGCGTNTYGVAQKSAKELKYVSDDNLCYSQRYWRSPQMMNEIARRGLDCGGATTQANLPNSSEKTAILKAVEHECTPNWCTPKLGTVIGEYTTVGFQCKKKDCEGSIAYLKKTGNKWTLVDYGTGILWQDLVSRYGFPVNVARALAP